MNEHESISRLLQACAQGDADTVQLLLDDGVHVDSYDEEGTTLLQMAAAYGQEKIVCMLLSRGAALDLPNPYGWTPLMHAARHGHTNVVALLLQQKAKVNVRNKLGSTALTMAVRSGQLSIVRLLLEAGIDIHSSEVAQCSFTDLMVAAQNGLDPLVKLLLDRGADVNYKAPSTGYTALMCAARNGHKNTAQILVERGADVNLTNICDKTALNIASHQGKRAVRSYLDNKTKRRQTSESEQLSETVLEATKNGNFDRVRDLLVEDLSQKDAMSPEDGATPIMFAAMLGHLDLVKLFIQMGANINAKDTVSGWTALMQAIFHGKNDVAKVLIEAGADVNIQAFNGCTAFDLASLVEDADAELIRLLASRTLCITDENFILRNSSNNNIPEILLTEDINPSKGLKAWWNRMSNHFHNLKLNKTFQNHHYPIECLKEAKLQTMHPRRSTNMHRIKNIPENERETHSLTETSPSSPFTLALPSPSLISDSIAPVVPPMLPSPNRDASSPNRNRMPPGKLNTPSAVQLSSPNPPSWATDYFCSTIISNSGSPNSSFQLGIPSPQSSGDSSKLSAGFSRNYKPSPNEKISNMFGNIHSYEQLGKIGISMPSRFDNSASKSALNDLTLAQDFNLTILNRETKSGSSKSSRSSKSSSTLTPLQSEVEDKSSGSDSGILGSTLQVKEESDEVTAILRKLSLEKYQPIFEAQEVDFEAFLSLSDTDLLELGIQQNESRQQILTAIDEANAQQMIADEKNNLLSTSQPNTLNHK